MLIYVNWIELISVLNPFAVCTLPDRHRAPLPGRCCAQTPRRRANCDHKPRVQHRTGWSLQLCVSSFPFFDLKEMEPVVYFMWFERAKSKLFQSWKCYQNFCWIFLKFLNFFYFVVVVLLFLNFFNWLLKICVLNEMEPVVNWQLNQLKS